MTKLLQQCFLFFIVVVIPWHNLGNSQLSVNRTIGPTLVTILLGVVDFHFLFLIAAFPRISLLAISQNDFVIGYLWSVLPENVLFVTTNTCNKLRCN